MLAAPVLALLVAAAAYAIGDAILAPAPAAKSPSFIDTVIASRAVVASIRVAIIFASGFVVVSVVALIAKRQWLTRVGPVHVLEDVSGVEAEKLRLERSVEIARDEIDTLRGDLAKANRLLDLTADDWESAR